MTQLVKGSLQHLAQRDNKSLAESFMQASTIVLIDRSGSMGRSDYGNQSRYKRAANELAKLQANNEGKIAVVAFDHEAMFCPSGVSPEPRGGTNIDTALQFVQIADGVVDQFVVISDGETYDEENTLQIAKQFSTPIHTIFIGPEGGEGEAFLKKLAKVKGGISSTTTGAVDLASKIETLMLQAPSSC